jgi:hypothetical protein
MKFYLIETVLTECAKEDILTAGAPYVAVMKPEEYNEHKDYFDMGIDTVMTNDFLNIYNATKDYLGKK